MPTWSWMLAAACLAAGCSADVPATAPVSGIVELDGKPLKGHQHGGVMFTPTGGRLAKGAIEPGGSFRLSTFTEEGGDGAIPGLAKVWVTATVNDPSAPPTEGGDAVRWIIPLKFGNPDTSGLACDVKAGEENVFRIKLSSDGSGQIEAE